MTEATIFHSSLLISFSSFSLATCTSLRTFLNKLSCFKSICFMESSKDSETLGGGASLIGCSSLMEFRLFGRVNKFGRPKVDIFSDPKLKRLWGMLFIARFRTMEVMLCFLLLSWLTFKIDCVGTELRRSYSISSRASAFSLKCLLMTLRRPGETLMRTSFASQLRTMVLTHTGISDTEGLL